MLKIIKKIKEKRQEKEKKMCMEKYGRYIAPNGTIYFDPARWVSPTQMRKFC